MKREFSFYGERVPLGAGRKLSVRRMGPKLAALLAASLYIMPGLNRAHSLPVTWGQRIEVAKGKAFRGPWRMNESVWHFVDDPTVAITDEGNVGGAWAATSP